MPRVIASADLRVPHESNPRSYIDETTPVDVPDTTYYRRRLLSGELLLASPESTAAPETKRIKA